MIIPIVSADCIRDLPVQGVPTKTLQALYDERLVSLWHKCNLWGGKGATNVNNQRARIEKELKARGYLYDRHGRWIKPEPEDLYCSKHGDWMPCELCAAWADYKQKQAALDASKLSGRV